MSDDAPTELSLLDVLQADKWSAALFTTFPLSLSFFEAAPLIKLRAANCRQITVLADVMGYGASTQERGAAGAGRSYELRPVLVQGGCFHPKLSLFLGADGPRALVGSGNLTFTGWARNLEFADYLSPQHAGQALRDVGDFLLALTAAERVRAEFGDLNAFVDACAKAPSTGSIRVVHDLQRPIVDALFDAVADAGGARALRIISPYFGNGDGVMQLADLLDVDDVGVFVCTKTREAFPFAKAGAAGLEVKRLGSPILDPHNRPLHGKAIEVETKSGRRVLLTGSVNVTRHALIEGANVELGVLHVLDEPSHYGWTPATVDAVVESGANWSGAADPVLTASLEHDGVIVGRILAASVAAGAWQATVVQGVRRTDLRDAEVAADGSFRLAADGLGQLAGGRTGATQLELSHGGLIVRGWLLLAEYLAAVREHGGFAEAAFQVIDGTADATAIEAVLEFFARNAVALPRQSTSGSSEDQKEAKELPDTLVAPASLAPQSIDSATARTPSETRSAGDRLLAALRIVMLRSPGGEGASDDESEGEDENEPSEGTRKKKARREFFDRFLDSYERRIARGSGEPDRRHDLLTLLGVIRYCAPRVEDGELRVPELQRRWLHLTTTLTDAKPGQYDAVEVEFALAVTSRVIEGRQTSAAAHGDLQRRWGGAAPADLTTAFLASVDSGSGIYWLASATPLAWRTAWERILASRTQWQNAIALLAAVRAAALPEVVEGFDDHVDLSLLRTATAAGTVKDRLLEMLVLPSGRVACPRCHMLMNAQISDRLRRTRLVRCDGRRCGRFIVYVGP